MVDAALPSLDAAGEDLVLRVHGTSRHGQLVRLKANRCTLGSAQNCTLRLLAPGIQPVHCLIIRGSGQTIVRRWNADTRLNGRGFDDSPIRAGDLLTLGPLEFEVLATGSVAPLAHPQAASNTPAALTTPAAAQPHDDALAAGESLAAAQRDFERRQAEWNEERRRTEMEIEAARADLERRHAEWNRLQRQQEGELEAAHQELAARERHWLEEQARQQAETEAATARLALRHAALEADEAAQKARLDRAWAELAQRKDEWQAEQNIRQTELDRAADEIARQRNAWEQRLAAAEAELEAKEAALLRRQSEWEELHRAEEEKLAQRWRSVEQRADELHSLQSSGEAALDQAPRPASLAELAAWSDRADDAGSESEPPACRLSSLGAPRGPLTGLSAPTAPDDDPAYDEACDQAEDASAAEPVGDASVERAALSHDDEESVDQYMARLMERVRGMSPGSAASAAPLPSEPQSYGEPRAAEDRPEPAPSTAAPSPPPAALRQKPLDMLPRTESTHPTPDLTAMRELAVLSAESAIDRHQRNRLRRQLLSKAAVVAVGLPVGMATWALAHGPGPTWPAILGTVACFALSAVWAVKLVLVTRQYLQLPRREKRPAVGQPMPPA